MASKYQTYVIRGELNWAKVLGDPVMNDFAKERQWSVDVSPNEEGLKLLKRLKLGNKIKDPKAGEKRGEFIAFRQSEFKKDGSPNDPITITDLQGNPWPANKKIGNGTIADVKFSYTDFGTTKGNYIKAIRVLSHVPYVKEEFAPLSEDDEFFAGTAGEAAQDDVNEPDGVDNPSTAQEPDLDDDVPF